MNKIYTTKGDLIKDIILSSDKPLAYKEIVAIFKERTEEDVSIPRIRQVTQEMLKNGEAKVERKIDENGNAIAYISSTKENNPHQSR